MNLARALPLVVGALCSISATHPAAGTTATTTFLVTATVTATCTVTANTLSFGTYGGATNLDGTTTITVKCTNGSAYQVGLNAGTAPGATAAARKMASGANLLTYALYSDAGRTTVWGDSVGGDTVHGIGTGLDQSLTVYGRVPAGQLPPVGSYTDTIGVTVYY